MIAALRAGANPNLVVDGKPVLHYAAANGFGDVVEELRARNVDLNRRDQGGMTALMWLAGFAHNEAQLRALDQIIAAGAALEEQAPVTGATALDMAAHWKNRATAETLVSAGALAKRRQTKLRLSEWGVAKDLGR